MFFMPILNKRAAMLYSMRGISKGEAYGLSGNQAEL